MWVKESTPDPMDRTHFPVEGIPTPKDPHKHQWEDDMEKYGRQWSPEEKAKAKAEAVAYRKNKLKELLYNLNTSMPRWAKDLHLEYMDTVTPDNEPLTKATEAEIHFGTKGPWNPSVVIAHITREVNPERPNKFRQWEVDRWVPGNVESESTLPSFKDFYSENMGPAGAVGGGPGPGGGAILTVSSAKKPYLPGSELAPRRPRRSKRRKRRKRNSDSGISIS
tara:strand:+ start:1169 stop:1834 length:666 start_codon:yes stop_codon:yes gene_type:complete